MKSETLLRKSDSEYLESMKEYLDQLQKQMEEDPQRARAEAKEALIRTGVADSNGKIKKKIVSWE